MSDVGKRILEDLTQDLDEDLFWEWFEPEEFYTRSEGAFRDEGDDFSCNLCDFEIEGWRGLDDDNAEDTMAEHIFEEHAEEIIMKAIRLQFTVKRSEKKQTSLEIISSKKEEGF